MIDQAAPVLLLVVLELTQAVVKLTVPTVLVARIAREIVKAVHVAVTLITVVPLAVLAVVALSAVVPHAALAVVLTVVALRVAVVADLHAAVKQKLFSSV